MEEFVSQWKQVIPLLPPNEIKKLEDILKQAQNKNGRMESSSSVTTVLGTGAAAPAMAATPEQQWNLTVKTDACDSMECDDGELINLSFGDNANYIPDKLALDGSTSSHNSQSSSIVELDKRSNSSLSGANPQPSPSDTNSHNGFSSHGTEKVYSDEAIRRAKRRERNRLAAAMCRKRRQDHISLLQTKVDKMKETTNDLNSKITNLLKEKEILMSVLQEHKCLNSDLPPLPSQATLSVHSKSVTLSAHLPSAVKSSVKQEAEVSEMESSDN